MALKGDYLYFGICKAGFKLVLALTGVLKFVIGFVNDSNKVKLSHGEGN